MMKRLWHVVLPFLCASVSNAREPVFEFSSAIIAKSADALSSRWKDWEKRFEKVDKEEGLQTQAFVKFSFSQLPAGFAAQSRAGEILVNRQIAPTLLDSVLTHELAHVFLSQHCKIADESLNSSSISALLEESFAIGISKDYFRISKTARDELLLSKSIKIFQEFANSKSLKTDSLHIQRALARFFFVEERSDGWLSLLSEYVKKCENAVARAAIEKQALEFWKLPSTIPVQKFDALVFDFRSKKVVLSKGDLQSQFPVASILKPLLVQQVPELQSAALSSGEQLWDCGNNKPVPSIWNWQEALVYSCNGFFLNREKYSLKNLDQFLLSRLGHKNISRSMPELIGILPTMRLSLNEVLKLYIDFDQTAPLIVDQLRKVFDDGTLKSSKDARWYLQNNYSAKTGSVRDATGHPQDSWIILWGRDPKQSNSQAAFLGIFHGTGISTLHLSEKIKGLLSEHSVSQDERIEVSVLNFHRRQDLKLSCLSEEKLSETFSGQSLEHLNLMGGSLKESASYSCPTGPILVRSNQFHRSYSGTLEFRKVRELSLKPHGIDALQSLRPKQHAVRNAGSLILKTSLLHYVTGVLLAEYPQGRDETLKALAFAVARNAKNILRHQDAPVCDSTHCQVFQSVENSPPALVRRLQAIALKGIQRSKIWELKNRNLGNFSEWWPFSLGGTKKWDQSLDHQKVLRLLNIASLNGVASQKGNEIRFSNMSWPCEEFREILQLRSCPTQAVRIGDKWIFSGQGEGHGLGIDLRAADSLAAQGYLSEQILEKYYPTFVQNAESTNYLGRYQQK